MRPVLVLAGALCGTVQSGPILFHSGLRGRMACRKWAFWGKDVFFGSQVPSRGPRKTNRGFSLFGALVLVAGACLLLSCCLFHSRRAGPPHCCNKWINRQKYVVLQLADPNPLEHVAPQPPEMDLKSLSLRGPKMSFHCPKTMGGWFLGV